MNYNINNLHELNVPFTYEKKNEQRWCCWIAVALSVIFSTVYSK